MKLDEVNQLARQPKKQAKRKNSFVGSEDILLVVATIDLQGLPSHVFWDSVLVLVFVVV